MKKHLIQPQFKITLFRKKKYPCSISTKEVNYKKKGIVHDFDHLKGLEIHSIFISHR